MADPLKLSDLFENLRSLLGDSAAAGTNTYKDDQLAAALRSAIQMGLGPQGVLLVQDPALSSSAPPSLLDPAPATPDARGYLVLQTALMMVGGSTPVNFKTRAMSASVHPLERQNTINQLIAMRNNLLNQGDPHGLGGSSYFGIWQDWENAVCFLTSPTRIA